MYAIIEVSGHQVRVEPGTRLTVNQIATPVGKSYTAGQVLLTHDGTSVQIGRPYCAGAKVVCEVVEHLRGPKVITYKFRRRENFRRTRGHRQNLSKLVVKSIELK